MPGTQTIEGLASNLDITEMVDTLMSFEKVEVTYMEQEKELKTQQVAAYNAVLAKFIALQTQIKLLKKESSYNKANIEISDPDVLSATATDRVTSGSYNLRVTSLAHNHQLASQGVDDATSNIFGTGTIQLAVGDASLTTISIDDGNNNLIGIKDAINNADVGVTASVINDGSSSNPYRLLLTADKTGQTNSIKLNVSLEGGETLDYVNSSFDTPEEISFATTSTAAVALGSSASYSGCKNKVYTFTVDGSGAQTIGSDIITINWSDGTNSGSIQVTQADSEVELVGEGADGLKLSLSSGRLTGGDTFQVTAFSPVLQKASDATIEIGGDTDSGGSSIVINSSTNEFKEVIPGLSLKVAKLTESGETVSINTSIDTDGIKTMITDFISKYNDIMDFIDNQFTYDQDTEESGILFADYSLQVMQSSLRSSAALAINELTGDIRSLASIGIRSGIDGKLSITNSSLLTEALTGNFDSFLKLFTDSAESSSPYIEFVSAGTDTKPGTAFDVDITQVATRGYYQGTSIDPAGTALTLDSSNNRLQIKVDGMVSNELVLSERTYVSGEDLANEVQTRLDADSKLKGRGVTVEWVEQLNGGGYLKLTSGSYGSTSSVQMMTAISNSAFSKLGLASGMVHNGDDVAGTINGEATTGKGQILTGNDDNATTAGLKLKVTMSRSQLVSGSAEATVTVTQGLSTKMDSTLENITKSIDGSIARRTSALNKQIEEIDGQIEDFNERLELRREDLYTKFQAMETAISEYQSVGTYLDTQLANLSSNWSQILGSD
nr:flagellar filament capping protein FliD [candidate division Zixibacteria bacterium]